MTYWVFLGLALSVLYVLPLWWRGEAWARMLAGCVLALGLIQLHLFAALVGMSCVALRVLHEVALFAVAPLLFLCVETLLGQQAGRGRLCRHLAPLPVAAGLSGLHLAFPGSPWLQNLLYGVAFAIGAGYAAIVIGRMRQLTRAVPLVRLETLVLSLAALTGAVAALLVFVGALLAHPLFPLLYGSSITLILVGAYLLYQRFPALLEAVGDELRDAADAGGLSAPVRRSQLGQVDIHDSLAALQACLAEGKRHHDEALALPGLAAAVGLSPHQLSELVNEHMGLSVPRLIRQYRVADAKEMLVAKPALSVLEVGLAVGFSSLSSFYAAFREQEGVAPGVWRKQALMRKAAAQTP